MRQTGTRSPLSRTVARFVHEEDGNLTVFSIFILMCVMLMCGAAVDLAQQESERVRLQTTLDRAVIAAADLDQRQQPVDVVADYVAKAGLGNYLTSVTSTPFFNERTVGADAGMTMDTLFLRLAGIDTLDVRAVSMAEERIANVEISLVLDISGSMRWNNRIENTREGAANFIRKVLTEESEGITTLNVVPFAGHVNPGTDIFAYLRGERPKLKGNNGWGNGDQDAPGGSLCNNNAENAEEGAEADECSDGTATAQTGHFAEWTQAISNVVLYFDTDGDQVFDRAHKIEGFPENAPRDMDDLYKGAVAWVAARDNRIDAWDFLGVSIKGGREKTRYFQVKGNLNGPGSDLGPTKNNGKLPGRTYRYSDIDFAGWESLYPDALEAADDVNVNMPGSCVEIYDSEFSNSALPTSSDYVPHFQFWPREAETMDWGWCPGEDTAIQYYSSNATQLVDFINNMRLHDGTGLQYGLKYALALLDPATRAAVSYLIDEGMVDSQYIGRPIAWGDQETEKFIVVMTDGIVTEQFRPADPDSPLNGELELQSQGRHSYVEASSQGNNLDNMHTQCALAKSQGVTVFMVAYETTDAAAAELSHCASSDSHFFHVQGSDVIETFDIIARQINNLRLIQ
ncbi:Flp pilus assembly protein TadG [Sagittula marina]|uniref:Flp pilus assembly protein TadG n=1 Tax=Sagittula marina TaxID=943940 RepID=A0A7W6DST7_9RHOB|nr:Tad domain-containing protein [Sagittula marina]MBB3986070.1 Flp pilus assembly protein TadG [Sagittula marina]